MIAECTVSGGPAMADAACDSAEPLGERELVEVVHLARQGHLAAQSELVRRYAHRLAGFLRGLVHDRLAIEDLSQTVWIKIVRRLPTLRDPATFESWLFTTARNAAVDYVRRVQCRPRATSDEFLLINVPAPSDYGGCFDLLEAIEVVTRCWSEQNRRILQDLMLGTSYQAIADREQVPVGAVKLRVHRVRRRLRAEVQSRLAELRGAWIGAGRTPAT